MSARPKPPAAGKGRQRGIPNKITRQLREMILAALDRVGGTDYLARQAEATPAAFMTLLGKILPTQLSGPDEGPIETRDTALERLESRLARLAAAAGAAGNPRESATGEPPPA